MDYEEMMKKTDILKLNFYSLCLRAIYMARPKCDGPASSLGVKEVQRKCEIELSEKILDSAERTRDTLLHELCHAVVWIYHGVNEGKLCETVIRKSASR